MKTIYFAAALGLVASTAHATIVPTTTVGGSDLLLSVWEKSASNGAPDQSFIFDLGLTFTTFVNTKANASSLFATLDASTDPIWQTFLSTSYLPEVQWAVIASGSKVPTTRPAIIATVAPGVDPALGGPNQTMNGQNVLDSNTQVSNFISALNVKPNPNEQISSPADPQPNGYYQKLNLSTMNGFAWGNSSPIGTTQGFVSATYAAGSTALQPSQLVVMPGTFTFARSGTTYTLNYNVSAVPEASGFALALAGFSMIGFVGLRRRND